LTAQLGGTHLEALKIALPSLRTPLSYITQLTALSGIREFNLRDTQVTTNPEIPDTQTPQEEVLQFLN
jgi:hypothetical protein